jgi:PII-like signaling protein
MREGEEIMLKAGPAKKVTVYVGETVQYHGKPAYLAILELLFHQGLTGATAVRGIAGFGTHHQLHTHRLLELSTNLPVQIEFIEEASRLEVVLAKVSEMVGTGLIEVQDTTVLKAAGSPSMTLEDVQQALGEEPPTD